MDRDASLAWELVGRYLSSRERVRAAATCRDVASAMAETGISAPLGPCRALPEVRTETPECREAVRAAIAGCRYVVRNDLAAVVEDDPTHVECDGECEEERYIALREIVLARPPPPGASVEFRTSCPSGPLEKLEIGEEPTFVAETFDLAAPEPASQSTFWWSYEGTAYFTDEPYWHDRVDNRFPRGPCVETSVDVGEGARLSLSFGGCEDHPDVRWTCPSFDATIERFEEKWRLVTWIGHGWKDELEDASMYEERLRNATTGRGCRRRGSKNMMYLRAIEARFAERHRVLGPDTEPVAARARHLALFARTIETMKDMRGDFPEECRERFSRVPLVCESSIEYGFYGEDFSFFDGRVLRAISNVKMGR